MAVQSTSVLAEFTVLMLRLFADVFSILSLCFIVAPYRLANSIGKRTGLLHESPRERVARTGAGVVHRSVLITGASRGIGEALAVRFSAPGVKMCISTIPTDLAALELVGEQCRARGAEVEVVALDVRDSEACRSLVQRLCQAEDRPLDLLIANAGICPKNGMKDCCLTWEINLMGVIHVVDPALRSFAARKTGQICLMSSLGGFTQPSCETMIPYVSSKQAIRSLAIGLRAVFTTPAHGVTITCVFPGMTDTEMTREQRSKGANIEGHAMWRADEAAEFMFRGIVSGEGEVAYPLSIYALAKVSGEFPYFVRNALAHELRKGDPFLPLDPPASSWAATR